MAGSQGKPVIGVSAVGRSSGERCQPAWGAPFTWKQAVFPLA
jgi:hypothetical protein